MRYLLWHYVTESARRYPTRDAVADGARVVTYAELDELSDRVAGSLLAAGVGRDCRVGLFLPKSAESVIAMIGTLKAGAAYVPIDPSAPARRALYILNDCRVSAVVTTSSKLRELGEGVRGLGSLKLLLLADGVGGESPELASVPAVALEQHPSAMAADRTRPTSSEVDPAYLLYTSGSTGEPKGVILSHRNAMTFVEWAAANAGLEARDRLSSHAPLHFDLSVFDLYAAFRVGARVSLVPDQVGLFPVELTRWIRDERISVWYSVPSALIRLLLRGKLAETELPDLRTVIFAGEVFPVKYLRSTMECLPLAEFLNWYGPTETNVCTYYRVPRPLDPSRTNLPIGRACENTEVIAFNAHGRPIALGEEGELYVRGPTVMLGYWGLPDRTGEQLVDNPLQPAYRDVMYRTGDIVRLEETGDYTFVGRRDHMVKSRGYRIELGEIEAALYQHESVLEAAVLALPDDEIGARLVAIVVAGENRTVEPSDLRAFCAARLPRYMVPEQYVTRTTLPRTSTGKTDRAALMSEFTLQPTNADKRSTKA